MSDAELIRVVLVDDHAMFREGTRGLLMLDPYVRIVGEAEGASEAFRLIAEALPDIALVDIRLSEGTGIGLAKNVITNALRTKVLILTAHADPGYVKTLVKIGVSGYLLKEASGAELLKAIHDVHAGEFVLGPQLDADVLKLPLGGEQGRNRYRNREITEREIEILDMLRLGFSNEEIGQKLGITEPTVKKHLTHLFAKLEARNRVEALLVARGLGILEGDT